MRREPWLRVVCVVAVCACGDGPPDSSTATRPPELHATTSGAVPRAPDPTRHPGVVVSEVEVEVRPMATARVAEVRVRNGARVEAGDVLVVLDTEDAKAELRIAKADLRALKAELVAARLGKKAAAKNVAAVEKLDASALVPHDDYDKAVLEAEQATLSVARLEAQTKGLDARLEKLQRQAADREIKAPVRGTVAERVVSVGDVANPTTTMVRLLGDGELRVRFAVASDERGSWAAGQRVDVRPEFDDGEPSVSATVTSVSPEVDPVAHMVFVDAELDGDEAALSAGLPVWVQRGDAR